MTGTLNVQFSDSSDATVISYFASPQDPTQYPNLGTVETSDARWVTFYDAIGGAALGLPAPTSN
jgi:hypothetical protein